LPGRTGFRRGRTGFGRAGPPWPPSRPPSWSM